MNSCPTKPVLQCAFVKHFKQMSLKWQRKMWSLRRMRKYFKAKMSIHSITYSNMTSFHIDSHFLEGKRRMLSVSRSRHGSWYISVSNAETSGEAFQLPKAIGKSHNAWGISLTSMLFFNNDNCIRSKIYQYKQKKKKSCSLALLRL